MSQSKRIEGARMTCPCCEAELLLTDDQELIVLGEPAQTPSRYTGIRTVEASPGWNRYQDPTHIVRKPLLQPVEQITPVKAVNAPTTSSLPKKPAMRTGKKQGQVVTEPVNVDAVLESSKKDLEARGIFAPPTPHPGVPNAAMSPGYRARSQAT